MPYGGGQLLSLMALWLHPRIDAEITPDVDVGKRPQVHLSDAIRALILLSRTQEMMEFFDGLQGCRTPSQESLVSHKGCC